MDWERIAEVITKRATELGISQAEVGRRAELSDSKVRDFTKARQSDYRPATITKMERALRWAPGSIKAIGLGGVPMEAPPEPGPRVVVRGHQATETDTANPGRAVTTPVETSLDIRYNTEAHQPSTRIAMAADEMSAAMKTISDLLSGLADQIDDDTPVSDVTVSRIKLESLSQGAGEFQASLDKLLARLNERVHTDL